VLKFKINRREPYVCNLIERLEAPHDYFADPGGGKLAVWRVLHDLFHLIDDCFKLAGRNRTLFAGAKGSCEYFVAVKNLTLAVLLDTHVGNFVDAFVRREPPRAFQAFAAPADGIAVLRFT